MVHRRPSTAVGLLCRARILTPRSRVGRHCPMRSGRTPGPRCTCGPRSSARSGWRRPPGPITPGTSRSTSRRAGSRRRRFPTARARSRSTFDFLDHAAPDPDRRGSGRGARARAAHPSRTSTARCSDGSAALGLDIGIRTLPSEIPDAIPFDADHEHASYDAEQATRFWRALVQADRVFKAFRARFIGKSSPVHFFWGSFDLAVTRFSGRRAPPHPGGVPNLPDWVAREAYSHEVSSCGFWPGGEALPEAVFYAYAYPEPEGFRDAPVRPAAAHYDADSGRVHPALRGGAAGAAPGMRRCSTSCRAPMRRPRTLAAGIAGRWSDPEQRGGMTDVRRPLRRQLRRQENR